MKMNTFIIYIKDLYEDDNIKGKYIEGNKDKVIVETNAKEEQKNEFMEFYLKDKGYSNYSIKNSIIEIMDEEQVSKYN